MKHCDFNKVASKEEFWKSIHLFYLSAEAKSSWDSILAFIPDNNLVQLFPSLHHKLVLLIIHEILHLENKNTPNGESQGDIVLSEEEQQVMRYVAGYIIYSLIGKYKKICRTNSNQCVSAAMEFLCSFKSNGDSSIKCESFLGYTRKWTELVNRGGLIEVNDNLFIFVRRTEICVQKILNVELLKNYKGEDLREIIRKKIMESSIVVSGWECVARNLENQELAKYLMKQVIDKWIDIRIRSFVNSFMLIVRRKLAKGHLTGTTTLAQKAEPAMRKTLN